jgi:alpha-beta hydrolase superfamily lysophospholipase
VNQETGSAGAERRRWPRLRWIASALLLGTAALNGVAYFHARAMVSWAASAHVTPRPELLGPVQRAGVLLTGVSIPRPMNRLTPSDVGLRFETHVFENGLGDELEAWYVPREDARALTLVFHGYAASKEDMLGIAQGLVELGSSVLLVDFYGSGGSSGTGTTLGVREAHDVRAALDYWRARWPRAPLVLYGQSMGGAAVLRAVAELGAEPDGIVAESTFDRLLTTVASRFRRMGLPGTPLAHLLVFWGGVHIGADGFAHDPVDYAASVRCPALVLHGELDPSISIEEARGLHARLGGWKRYSEYPGTGHVDLRSADPRRWQADLEALLAEVDAPGP